MRAAAVSMSAVSRRCSSSACRAERGGRLGVPGGVQGVLGVHEHPGPVGAERGQAALDGRADRVGLVLDAGQLLLGAGEVRAVSRANRAANSSSLVRKLE